jgi:hypothetical protein
MHWRGSPPLAPAAVVEDQRGDAGLGEPAGKGLQVHFLHGTETVGQGDSGHAGVRRRGFRQEEPSGGEGLAALEHHVTLLD